MFKIEGKVVLLTGGSRGLGPIIAQKLVDKGALIGLCARSAPDLQKAAQSINSGGSSLKTFQVDLTKEEQRTHLVKKMVEAFGRIDILVNNAGLETEGSYTELPWESIRETIEVNLIAPMQLTYLVLPGMIKRNEGHIVNIASIAAKSGAPYAATYSGTKAGLSEWTRALRLELAKTGVRFSTIFPGYVREVGMFARFKMNPPWIIGSCAPHEVAAAVVKAIEKGRIESIINTPPLRYSFAMNEISPRVGDAMMRISGLVDFQRRKVGK